MLQPVIDFLAAIEAGTGGFSDENQLTFATAQARVLVTFDQEDFPGLHGEWARAGREHSGIVVLTDQHSSPEVIGAKLARLFELRTAEQMVNVILFLNGDPNQPLT